MQILSSVVQDRDQDYSISCEHTHVLALQDMLMSFIGFVTSQALVQLMIKRDSHVVAPTDDGFTIPFSLGQLSAVISFEVRSL